MVALLSLVAAYLLGAIPCSYLVSRWAGHDLRELGDGNIGAHNVMRHVGRGCGWLALALDAAKGALAVGIALYAAGPGWLPVIAGWLAALGHNYPLWLRFRGGKGLATSLGVGLALFPGLIWLIAAGAALLLILTRNLAFSGVALGLALAVSAWLWAYPMSYVVAPLGLLLLMAWKQIPDLLRMWREAPDKRDLILNRWIRDREAKL
ncbi:MAG TPA: glycerol-3-phosphate acyltransferase [Herpetosiphonaceae bacterium]